MSAQISVLLRAAASLADRDPQHPNLNLGLLEGLLGVTAKQTAPGTDPQTHRLMVEASVATVSSYVTTELGARQRWGTRETVADWLAAATGVEARTMLRAASEWLAGGPGEARQ